MLPRIILKICLITILLSACNNELEDTNTINIKIYTAGLGVENNNFPQDIIELWSSFTVQGKKISPNFELIRIDQSEEVMLTDIDSEFNFIPPEPSVKLDREKEALQTKKIDARFAQSKASNLKLALGRIAKYQKNENVFYLKSYFNNVTSYDKPADLLEALKARISQSQGNQEYVIVYNLIDQGIIDAKNVEIKNWQDAAIASKQSADRAAADALTAAENAQNSLQRTENVVTITNRSVEEASCDKAQVIVAKMGSFKQAAENAKNTAVNAAKDAESNKQKANQYAEAAQQAGADKQTIETAAKLTAVAATAADKNKQAAKTAAEMAVRAAVNAEQNQPVPKGLCQKIPESPKNFKKDNVRKSSKKLNVQQSIHEVDAQEDRSVDVEETANDEFADIENKLHQNQNRLTPYINK